jgi:HSP20 family protein
VTRIYFDRRDLDEDVWHLFDWVDGSSPSELTVEYRPRIDVVETADAVEIVADLPGVGRDAVRVAFTRETLIIAGRKQAPGCEQPATTFHLAERTFGRFACGIRLTMAVDAGRARASLKAGELHIRLPRIDDRRGHEIEIDVGSA